MELKNTIYTIAMFICVAYVVILTFSSSKILALRAGKQITEQEYLDKRKSISKKIFICFIILVTLTITS